MIPTLYTKKHTETCFFCNKGGELMPVPDPQNFGAVPNSVTHFDCIQEAYRDLTDKNT